MSKQEKENSTNDDLASPGPTHNHNADPNNETLLGSSQNLEPSSSSSETTALMVTPPSQIKPIETKKPEEETPVRKYVNEDFSHPNWATHKKHMFILSSSGKPIYSRYGDEQNLSPFMASLTAMVAYVQDMGDKLNYLVAGKHKFVFLSKGPIILVCVARTQEPVSHYLNQLNYLYLQIVSILTSNFTQIFAKKPSYDLRTMMGGADRFLDSLTSLMDRDASFLLNAIRCLRLDASIRSTLATVIQTVFDPNLLYAILIGKYQLVHLMRPKKYILQPSDLHLILNFVNSGTGFKSSEAWTPICLPKFEESGFLHAYVNFIDQDLCLMLISTLPEAFYKLSSSKNTIVQGMKKYHVFEPIRKALKEESFSVAELNVPGLLHFLYKSKQIVQYIAPKFEAPYSSPKDRKRLMRIYQKLHRAVHKFSDPHKVLFQVSEFESCVAWVTSGFELYAVFGPADSKQTCIKACNDLLQWIKNEENSLFILNSPVW